MPSGRDNTNCSAVILAGGLNTRMGGRNKAFIEIGGRTILDRLLGTLTPFFTRILLVTRQPELYGDLPLRVVQDVYKARSSLTGIHAGLTHIETDHALMLPCDAPYIQPALIRLLLDAVEPEIDAVVPQIGGYYEPLCAVYSRRCIAPIAAQLDSGVYKITRFFDEIRVRTISEAQIRAVDPDLRSFLNVNNADALQAILAQGRDRGTSE